MQTLDEEPLETIHLYVVREGEAHPPLLPIFLALVTLSVLLVLCTVASTQQPEERLAIRIPAVFLPLKSFTSSVPIVPTGVKIIPATTAHGELTVTNGSVISQIIPKGFIVANVATDNAVFVPAGSANGYGYATVQAHALVSGKGGNVATLAINQVEGSSVYIRNLSPFIGGEDSYSVKIVTQQDRQTALDTARVSLTMQVVKIHEFLAYPCQEVVNNQVSVVKLVVKWSCQFVTFSVPSYMKVTHVKLVGKTLLVDVVFVPRPRSIEFK